MAVGVGLAFSFPVYLVVTLSVSFFIDKVTEKKKRYWNRLLVFIGMGIVTGIVLLSIFPNIVFSASLMTTILFGALLGAIASTVFFHLQLLIEMLSKK